ncbi:DUF4136 domain-containing protein [Algivirga pacifica]|uniref:DUF4136 domain-containing protein n=1 Tax=Algivirga pacifica TaxID=1162670 RepID=A0ABP9DIR1_9BACT
MSNLLNQWKRSPFFLLITTLLYSCDPYGERVITDYDTVTTYHDQSFNFVESKTYSMPDSVVYIVDKEGNGEAMDEKYNQLILETIKEEMEQYGYTLLPADTKATADLFLTPTSFSSTHSSGGWWGYYNWWDSWGWYDPMYGWGWGPGWNIYYPYPITYSYQTGTVIIEILDTQHADEESRKVPVVWTAICDGLLESNSYNLQERIKTGISNAFMQSPYLDRSQGEAVE